MGRAGRVRGLGKGGGAAGVQPKGSSGSYTLHTHDELQTGKTPQNAPIRC